MAYALRRGRKYSLDPSSRRRALALLADAGPEGVTESLMLANDVKVETLVALVKQGLATATPQRIRAGGKTTEVATLRIATVGRRVLEGSNAPRFRASVSILRPYVLRRGGLWNSYDPSLNFESMNRSEKKRAELSISDAALKMLSTEIEVARHLTDLLFDWLSQRRKGVPYIQSPVANARIWLDAEGTEELVSIVEAFGDPELLDRAAVGAVFMQGEPRRPGLRWLPDQTGVGKTQTLGDLPSFERSLADEQGARMRDAVDRVTSVFRKRLSARRAALNKRYTELWGIGSQLQIGGESVTDDELERWSFRGLQARIEQEAPKKSHGKTRVWRCDN